MLSLISPADVQQRLAKALRERREAQRLSRRALSERSTVPEPTIKRFETTGDISLRQFLILWSCVDDLKRLDELTRPATSFPKSIDEVLSS
ncbi:XRE family transcriptional regulator [Marinobacter sp. NP-4(2019)]|uniref:helix-turn-helix domain-containing protein n=1 Tax=Marinobacter sp. NP-4(2019) TaxID=2488665 RepID=UPI000FC3EE50|nr:helix-turn-helix domain-containing protein [Marinobacter sp. NP-4(2019)]AZT82343.1 XRE family transcriptional regulator [Marinobacter sp. NP-4(2019)]